MVLDHDAHRGPGIDTDIAGGVWNLGVLLEPWLRMRIVGRGSWLGALGRCRELRDGGCG